MAALTLRQWTDRVRVLIGEAGARQHVDDHVIVSAIETALIQYGSDRPRRTTETFPGDSTAYDFTLAGWAAGRSYIVDVEYPTGDQTRQLLGSADWEIIEPDTFRTISLVPATGETLTVTYTTPVWPVPDANPNTDVVPAHDYPGVAALAGSVACLSEAASMARRQNAAVQGQRYDADGAAMESVARHLRSVYDQIVNAAPASGAGADTGAAAGEPAIAVTAVQSALKPLFRR